MLTANNITKSYGIEIILKNISFTLNPGERLGLVGPNGCGKTTLLRILTGLEKPDSGTVRFDPPYLRVGYLSQGFSFPPGETLGSFLARMEGDLPTLTHKLESLAEALTHDSEQAELQEAYDSVLEQMAAAAENDRRGPAVLAALGLDSQPQDLPATTLSGGQKTRLALAGVLLSTPQLLLLDEPTNHLDLDMLAWLEEWLVGYPSAALIVSHDRAFLERVVNGILEIDPHTHSLRAYPGNYSDYAAQKAGEWEHAWQGYSDQQVEIVRLENAARHLRGIAKFRKGGKADTGDKFAKGFFANRGRQTIGRAKHIEARLEHLLTDEHIDKPIPSWQMKIAFGAVPNSGRDVVALERLAIGYSEAVLLHDLDLTLRYGERVALIGPNGSGKSTLVRTILGEIPPLAGRARLGSNVRPGYMAQEQTELDPTGTPLTLIHHATPFDETEARAFLSMFLFKGDDVFTPVGKLSYGERARLSLACLVANGCNFLVLDEPINHLDIPARARFEQALGSFPGTVLAVAHDRYFIANFATRIWEVRDGQIITYGNSSKE